MTKSVNRLSEEEIALVRESSLLVGKTLAEVARMIAPGVTTAALDQMAEEFIRDHGGVPGFKGLYGCPSTLLISVNEQVVHGLPGDRALQDGDVASVDCGVLMNEFYGDSAYTFQVGDVAPEVRTLLRVTQECLALGIEQATANHRTGDIGYAIQQHAEAHGYGIVRELVGHGVGRKLHEAPEVPNYGKRGHGAKLNESMVIAIEPMVNMGVKDVSQLDDGWTVVTRDGKPSAHFEHTIAVRNGKAEVLSTFSHIESVLKERGMATA
ncbi:MAG: type I methionyl aminopeptidase [Flavobacteriales bacterium]|jgi:methionyl aminopeptidase|nr:type I methionyl aminopeptidase [Flavobacteriales bacterium]MBK6892594.1 type I methionyl aminopeptidase [Flavobacteriales bacterium]MBK7246732.1 type I methionyl aminopeptidase [Flavobacteriales bacterium]MBK9598696.1 type I methionyl aminopeptidase [Flavobacteriales bacterium]QQS72407.1 MAG: type I methionyl aminopeptidase [Flavobacteriales bacterium]